MEMWKTVGILFAMCAVFFIIGGKRGKLLGSFMILIGIPMQLIGAAFPGISILLNFFIALLFAGLIIAGFWHQLFPEDN